MNREICYRLQSASVMRGYQGQHVFEWHHHEVIVAIRMLCVTARVAVNLSKNAQVHGACATGHLSKCRFRNEHAEPTVARVRYYNGFQPRQTGIFASGPIADTFMTPFVTAGFVKPTKRPLRIFNETVGKAVTAAQYTAGQRTRPMYCHFIRHWVKPKSRRIDCSMSPIVIALTYPGPAVIHWAGSPQLEWGPS